eukprot:2294502-Prymnesium_polylepis.1
MELFDDLGFHTWNGSMLAADEGSRIVQWIQMVESEHMQVTVSRLSCHASRCRSATLVAMLSAA